MTLPKVLLTLAISLSISAFNLFAQTPIAKPDASTLFESAVRLAREGKFEESLAEFRRAEKLEPRRIAIQLGIGGILLSLKRFSEAVTVFEKAAKLDPADPRPHGGLCEALAAAGRPAAGACGEAARLEPARPEYRKALAKVLLAEGRTADAIRVLEEAASAFQNDIGISGLLGSIYALEGDFAKAAYFYERIIRLDPKNAQAYLRVSDAYAKLDRPREAVAAARKYVELRPKDFVGYFNLGQILGDAGFYIESIEPLRRAVELNGSSGAAYKLLSNSYEALGDKENALGSLRHAYKYLPPDARLAFRFGYALAKFAKYAEAVEPLERANKLAPNDPDVLMTLGLAYFESGQYEKAMPVLMAADKLMPNHEVIQMYMRVTRTRQRMVASFQEILDAARSEPDNRQVRLTLAGVYLFRGEKEKAEQEYLAVVRLSPKDHDSYNRLGIFYGDTGNQEKALEYFQKAVELFPHHVLYWSVAGALEKLGRLDEAIETMEKSIAIKSTLPETQVAYGDLLLKRGRAEEALKAYQAAVAIAPANPRPNFALAWLYIQKGNKEGVLRQYEILKSIAPGQLQYLSKCIRAHYGM